MQRPDNLISIVGVKANDVMSETFLTKMVTECKSGVGLAVRESGKLVIEKFHELDPAKAFTLINKININTKKFERQFFFCSFLKEFDEDEVPPYAIIKDSKGNPMLIVGCEGDFKVSELPNEEGFGEAFVLMHEYLGPKIEEMYKVLGNNPGNLFNYLKTDTFAADLKTVTGFRGVFSFMPSVGEPFILGDPKDIGGVFSWGTASNAFGYTESATNAASPAAAAPAVPLAKTNVSKYASDDDEPIAPRPKIEPKPVAPVIVPSVPAVPSPKSDPVEHVAKTVIENGVIEWRPPAGLHGKKLKAAYRAVNNGLLPHNWADKPTLQISAKRTTSKMEPGQTAAVPLAAAAAAAKPAAAAASAPEKKLDVLTVPVISGLQQASSVEFIKKYLGDGSVVLAEHPLETQKAEEKLPKFSELTLKSGDLDEIMQWPTAGIFKYVKDNPELSALLIIEYRRDRKNRQLSAAAGDKTMAELAGTEEAAPIAAAPKKASGASRYE